MKPDSFYTRYYDITAAKQELADIKQEAEAMHAASLNAMERGEV